MSSSTLQPLNILCFGDSLTEGYSMYGMKMTPYSRWMKECLKEKLGGEYEFLVDTSGRSGDCVIGTESISARRDGGGKGKGGVRERGRVGGFEGRMGHQYSLLETNAQDPYDWVVFLGGTNDMAMGYEVDLIWQTIVDVTNIPLGAGARVLLMTVPECATRYRKLDEAREELNRKIREDDRAGVYVFDLNKKLTYHDMGAEDRHEMWDDGLHFSEAGYEAMGKLVGERLIGILEGREARIEKGYENIPQTRFVEVDEEDDEVDWLQGG